MFTYEQFQQLKVTIQNVVPAIMELKLGCVIRNTKHDYLRTIAKYDEESDCILYIPEHRGEDGFDHKKHYNDKGAFEIFGRPIRLSDILAASFTLFPDIGGVFTRDETTAIVDQRLTIILFLWDKNSDDLDSQTDECKQFLVDLFVK